jgi:hypothetical protein
MSLFVKAMIAQVLIFGLLAIVMFGILDHVRVLWYLIACVVVNAIVRAILRGRHQKTDAGLPNEPV